MEKKSALIGGGIGLAVGMVSMFGLVLGIGSCAGSQNVKKVDNGPVLVQRPKLAKYDGDSVECYRISLSEPLTISGADGNSMLCEDSISVYSEYKESVGGPPVTTGIDVSEKQAFIYSSSQPVSYQLGYCSFNQSGSNEYTRVAGAWYLSSVTFSNATLTAFVADNFSIDYGALSFDSTNSSIAFEVLPEPAEPSNVVTDIFDSVVESISSFGQALGSSVSAITSVFYQDGAFTMLGYLTLITGGVALVYWVFYFLKRALHIGVK